MDEDSFVCPPWNAPLTAQRKREFRGMAESILKRPLEDRDAGHSEKSEAF